MASFFDKIFDEQSDRTARKPMRKPWWLATNSVRHGLLMAASYLVMAVGVLIVSFFLSPVVARMFAVLWLVLAAWLAASAAVVHRREPDSGEAAGPPENRESHGSSR